jgi:hypothetical protein
MKIVHLCKLDHKKKHQTLSSGQSPGHNGSSFQLLQKVEKQEYQISGITMNINQSIIKQRQIIDQIPSKG